MTQNEIFIKGIYRDLLQGPDNRVIFDSGWRSNTVVQQCRSLIAGFIKNDSSSGIQYLAVGKGKEEWDKNQILDPVPDTVMNLESPYPTPLEVKDLDLCYLDESDNVSNEVSNRLQIKATLKPGYPHPIQFNAYPLREFGLFGRFSGKDFMINCIRHPVIYKDASATLIRTINLFF